MVKKNVLYFSILFICLGFSAKLKSENNKLYDIRLDNYFGSTLAVTDSAYQIKGRMAYIGSGMLESIYLNYQVDEGDTITTFFDNINLNPQIPLQYEAELPWYPDASGSYQLKIWFSGLNGDPADETASYTLDLGIDVYDFLPERQLVLLESFSSMNCGSCAYVNPVLRNMVKQNQHKYAMVFYHALGYENSPLYNFNPKDHNIRREFYEVFYSPYAAIGALYQGNAEVVNQNLMELERVKPAGFTVDASYHIEEDMLYAVIETESFADFNNHDLRLLVVLSQDSIGFNAPPGGNGEKDFYNVMRTFIPDAHGIELKNQSVGSTSEFELSYKIPLADVDTTSMQLLAFIQDFNTMDILQMMRLNDPYGDDDGDGDGDGDDDGDGDGDGDDDGDGDGDGDDDGDGDGDETSIENAPDSLNVFLYPNPVNDVINVSFSGAQPVTKLGLFDLRGNRVLYKAFTQAAAVDSHRLDVSHLDNGVYILQMEISSSIIHKKVIIAR